MVFCGIDLHSNRFTSCFIYEDGSKKMMTGSVSKQTLAEFRPYFDDQTCVIIEASTNTFKFVEAIQAWVREVVIVNTYKMKMIPMTNKKTDKIDAEKLAIYLKMCKSSGEELIKPVYLPEQTIQDLRSLFATHELLKRQAGALKNRIHALLKQQLQPFTKEYIFGKKSRKLIRELDLGEVATWQIALLCDELEAKEKVLAELEEKIKVIGAPYRKEIEVLTSMSGISVHVALAVIADIATVDRFPNAKHFTSYLRSAPEVDSSNETTIIKGTNKMGRRLSVTLLTQCLNHFRDGNPRLHHWYERKEAAHQRKGKLRMALCRKVFAEMYQMLKKQEYHYYRDRVLHEKKMKEYDLFLEGKGIIFKKSA